MVAVAEPPLHGVRGDTVDDLPLVAVIPVPLLPTERALGAPPELHLSGQHREEHDEHDIGVPLVRDDPHGGVGGCKIQLEGGEKPILNDALLDEGVVGGMAGGCVEHHMVGIEGG